MQVQQDVMNNFLSLLNTRFVIPVYQRNYAWGKENCAKLLEDIVFISEDATKTHFMGTITYIIHHVPLENGIGQRQEYVIIDGQQRITSIMLLLKALQNKINDEGIKKAISRIINDDTTTNRLRLKPIKKDFQAFQCVMEGREHSGKSDLEKNYHFFEKELDFYMEKGIKPEDIYSAFLRLKIVAIGLVKGEDDPQVVFESINGKGVHLDGIDLVRNFLLMGENSEEQERLYGKYWQPIEDKHIPDDKHIKDFLEHYLRIYQGMDVKKDDVYVCFKELSKTYFNHDLEKLMADMLIYAKIYKVFLNHSGFNFARQDVSHKESAMIRLKIGIIVKLKFGVSYPFIMRIMRDFEDGTLDFANFESMLKLLISYHVRRQICKYASAALNKVMYGLYEKLSAQTSVGFESLAQFLGSKNGTEIFPNDNMVKTHFKNLDAYSLKFACRLVLFEIEKLSNVEVPDIDDLTIEHFYPQRPKANDNWRDMAGDYKTLEDSYRYTFGNLSLTAQNAFLGNKSFEEKITIFLERGSLHLNEYFTNQTSWGIDEILNRSGYLAERFCEVDIFRDLPNEYRVIELRKSIADDLSFYKFTTLTLPNGETKNASGAKGLAKVVIDYLYGNHHEVFNSFMMRFDPSYIVRNKEKAKLRENKPGWACVNFGDFYFVSTASFQEVGKNLRELIEACGLNPQSFTVE